MTDGIKVWVNTALDTKDELAKMMMDAGMEPEQALLASTVVTRALISEKIDEAYERNSAAQITTALSGHRQKQLYLRRREG